MRRKAGARRIRQAPGGGGGRRPGTFRRIMHASDFSRASTRAFVTALALARAGRVPLTIAHVLAPFVPVVTGEGFILPETYERLDASARATAASSSTGWSPGPDRPGSAPPGSSSTAWPTSRSSGRSSRAARTSS